MVFVEGRGPRLKIGGVSSRRSLEKRCDDSGCAIGSLSLLGEGEDVSLLVTFFRGRDADGRKCSEADCSRRIPGAREQEVS